MYYSFYCRLITKKIEIMKISELQELLEKLKSEHGDINCCISEPDEYWGSFQSHMKSDNVNYSENARPNGPKTPAEACVVFNSN